jgi:hypothetical protein
VTKVALSKSPDGNIFQLESPQIGHLEELLKAMTASRDRWRECAEDWKSRALAFQTSLLEKNQILTERSRQLAQLQRDSGVFKERSSASDCVFKRAYGAGEHGIIHRRVGHCYAWEREDGELFPMPESEALRFLGTGIWVQLSREDFERGRPQRLPEQHSLPAGGDPARIAGSG